MTRAGTRRPSPWTLAAGLVVIAVVSFTGAGRAGGEVGRLERAERLSFLLEARAYEQAALEHRTAASGAPDGGAAGRRAAAVRQELIAAMAELLRSTAVSYSAAASAAQRSGMAAEPHDGPIQA